MVIKQEAVNAVDLEERVVKLCKENPKGITDQIISQDMPNIPPQQRVTAINRLLSMVGIPSNPGCCGLRCSPPAHVFVNIVRLRISAQKLVLISCKVARTYVSVPDRRVSYAPHDWPNSYVCVTVEQ